MRTALWPALDRPASKTFRAGTHRVVAPEDTVAWVRPLLPALGITRVANVTGLDSIGIPVVMVCRPNSRSLAVAQGKGSSVEAAKASGLMESIEQYHAEHIGLPLKLASYEELRYTHRVVEVERLSRIAGSLFHPHFRLLWIEGYDLLSGEQVWVPYEVVHLDFTLPLPTGSGCFFTNSNGLASGNHVLEAVSHGICEVVERDATSIWNLRSDRARERTRIDLDTIDDPACLEVLEKYERANIAVAVWDATNDVGIPVFTCVIVERAEAPLRQLYATAGFGCHPARHIALLRALTEAAQSRLTFIAGSRDDALRRTYECHRNPDVVRTVRQELSASSPLRSFREAPTWESDELEEDVAWEVQCLRSAGVRQVVVVDLTKPEFRIPVVRVVIPGLEGTDRSPGYVPGPRARAVLARDE